MDNMTIEELKEHKMNAIAILEEESEYKTAKATEEAFDLLIAYYEEFDEISDTIDKYYIPSQKSTT